MRIVNQSNKRPKAQKGKARQSGNIQERWVKLVKGLLSQNPDLFGSFAISELKKTGVIDHGMRAQIRLAALARKYIRFRANQKKLRMIGKLGQFFNRYIKYRHEQDHDQYGFRCLHHICSEGCGSLQVYITNKQGLAGSVRVRTVDGGAQAGDDFQAVDKIVNFRQGEAYATVEVPIFDDDAVEDDEDFFIELVDAHTNQPLYCADTKTRVTITDDDGPQNQPEFKMSM